MPLSDDEWVALARGWRRVAARIAPQWTDANASDPGVTVVELLAFALDALSYRNDRLSDDARSLLRTVGHLADVLAGDAAASGTVGARSDGSLVRPRFFSGQLLTADDLSAAQDYARDRIDRRNRLLYGSGIVDGLAVAIENDGARAAHVVVAPGLAFDRHGREIFVGCAVRVALPKPQAPLVVQLGWREEPIADVPAGPAAIDDADAAPRQASRVVETFAAAVAATVDADAVAIARVRPVRGRWQLDGRFRAPRVRR